MTLQAISILLSLYEKEPASRNDGNGQKGRILRPHNESPMKKIAWKKISQFEGPEQSPGFLLWQVSANWRRLIEVALAEIGLTHPQFVLLASLGWLNRNQSEVTQVELARHFIFRNSSDRILL